MGFYRPENFCQWQFINAKVKYVLFICWGVPFGAFYSTLWNLNKKLIIEYKFILIVSCDFSNMLRVHLLIRIGFHATTCVRNITFTGQGILLRVATAYCNNHIFNLWCPQRRDVLAFMVIYPVIMRSHECLNVHGAGFS